MEIAQAKTEGYNAYYTGKTTADNPYSSTEQHELFNAWAQGFLGADSELEFKLKKEEASQEFPDFHSYYSY